MLPGHHFLPQIANLVVMKLVYIFRYLGLSKIFINTVFKVIVNEIFNTSFNSKYTR